MNDNDLLKRMTHFKSRQSPAGKTLGDDAVAFYKQVKKRQDRLGTLGQAWDQLVPPLLADHCCLDALARGVLSVIVDSASVRFELKQLLAAGLEQQLKLACPTLRKVSLKPGSWYDAQGRPRF